MKNLQDRVALRSAQIAPNKDAAHPFDIEHGTDTGGYLSPAEIVTGHVHDEWQYGYSAIAPSVFRQAIARWRNTLSDPVHDPGAYSFVDLGAGKGRAVLLASQLPFRSAIGVELSAELAQIAHANIEIWKRAGKASAVADKLHIVNQDALRFSRPGTSLLVFMYNPFACELVEQVLERLEKTAERIEARNVVAQGAPHAFGGDPEAFLQTRSQNPRGPATQNVAGTPSYSKPNHTAEGGCATQPRIDLLYVNPTCADVLSKRGKWVLQWTDRIDMDAADVAADPYGTTFDRVSCYRLRS